MTDKIKGGLADNMTLEQIAEKHGVTLSVIESALADGIAVEMEHTDDKEQATEIAKDHLFEDAEYYSKLKTIEKHNAVGYTKPVKIQTISVKKGDEWSKTYVAAGFIEKGVCTYNEETVYISQETLNRCIHTIKCKPNVIKHQKVTEDNVEELAVGSTTDIGTFNSETASFDVPFIIFKEEGKQKIADGWSVSCAYIPKAFGKGGTWHNTPYDREVTELEFTHLALVPDPRYEDAKIYENAMDEDDVSDEDRWITIGAEEGKKGKKVLIKAGQTAEEAIKDKFSEWASKSKDQQKLFDTKEYKPEKDYYVFSKLSKENKKWLEVYKMTGIPPYGKLDKELEKAIDLIDKKNQEFDKIKEKYKKGQITFEEFKKIKKQHDDYMEADITEKEGEPYHFKIEGNKETSEKEETKTTGKVQRDSKKFDNYVKHIQTKLKSLKTKEDRKAYIDYIQREVEEWSEDVNYADAVEFVLKSEKQNSTDNTTKENYNMENDKVEVPTALLDKLFGFIQQPFLNAKEEKKPKEEEKIEKDDDELEYEGKKYSKKELVNAFESACAGKKKEEEKENSLEQEESDDDIEFFNSMQKLMAEAQADANDKVELYNQNKGLELGSKAFG